MQLVRAGLRRMSAIASEEAVGWRLQTTSADMTRQIRAILTTQQGEDTVDLRESVLYGWV